MTRKPRFRTPRPAPPSYQATAQRIRIEYIVLGLIEKCAARSPDEYTLVAPEHPEYRVQFIPGMYNLMIPVAESTGHTYLICDYQEHFAATYNGVMLLTGEKIEQFTGNGFPADFAAAVASAEAAKLDVWLSSSIEDFIGDDKAYTLNHADATVS
ncbi:MAG: hypothetical protein JWL77_3510 [Chthonomonadaceae bacterium]|nr:hypothetical protein [Chthonomonadaceae bacterium]